MRQALRTLEIWSTVLTSFAGPTTNAASDGGPAGNSELAARRIAPVSSSTATVAPPGTSADSTFAKCSTPSSNSRYSGPWTWSSGSSDSKAAALAERHVQVRMLVVGEHDRHRTLDVRQARVEQWPTGTRCIDDVAVAEQDEGIDALLLHGGPQPGTAFAVHSGAIGGIRDVEQRRSRGECRHEMPRNFLTLVLTIFTAASGPTASTTDASDFSEYPNVDSLCG